MRLEILGVPIDGVTETEALERVRVFLDEPRGHLVTTPNPEMLVLAQKDQKFKDVLRQSDLAIPDGAGLMVAATMRGHRLPARVTGADFTEKVAELAAEAGKSIYLLGAGAGVAVRAAGVLKTKFPKLKIAGASAGDDVRRDAGGHLQTRPETIEAINLVQPDILFVAYGHGVQEEWIAENMARLPSVRVAMGIGGTFDFLAGKVRRAPKLMRRLGLEWLWRLIIQPQRWHRIWTAVAVFPFLVMTEKRWYND